MHWRKWPLIRDWIQLRENLRVEQGLQVPVLPVNEVMYPQGLRWVHIAAEPYGELLRGLQGSQHPIGICLDRMVNRLPMIDFEPFGVLARVLEVRGDAEHLAVLLSADQRFRIVERRVSHGMFYAFGYQQREYEGPLLESAAPALAMLELMLVSEGELGADERNTILHNARLASYRLAERLPLPPLIKLKLLELDDPAPRLEVMARYLRRQRLLAPQPQSVGMPTT